MVNEARSGHSLIEALVALVLFGGGLLAIAAAATHGVATLRRAELRQGAREALLSVTDSVTQWASPTAGFRASGPYFVSWSVVDSGATARVTVRVSWADGTRQRSDSLFAFTATTPDRLHVVP